MDVSQQETQVFNQLDELRSQERAEVGHKVRTELYNNFLEWINSGYRADLKRLIPKNGLNRDKSLAEASSKLARVLYTISEDHELRDVYANELVNLLIQDPNSIVNCLGDKYRGTIESHLVGVFSILTALHLFEETAPGSISRAKLSQVITEPNVDIRDKVDLRLEFSSRQKKFIRLIQLKSQRANSVDLFEVVEEKPYLNTLSGNDSRQILQATNSERRQNLKADVRAYVILVPSVDKSCIGNVYGKITDPSIIGEFASLCRENKFFPTSN